jgi:hypothetical protein
MGSGHDRRSLLLLVDVSALLANLPVAAGAKAPFSFPVIRLLSIIQPTVILSFAVFVGIARAPKVSLSSPVAEAWARSERLIPALLPQVGPGLVGGLVGGIAIFRLGCCGNRSYRRSL